MQYSMKLQASIFKDIEFLSTREAIDSAMKKSAAQGSVKPKKRAAVVTKSKEDELWVNGSFGCKNSATTT